MNWAGYHSEGNWGREFGGSVTGVVASHRRFMGELEVTVGAGVSPGG